MSIDDHLNYKLQEGKAICIFNVFVESSRLNSFAKIHTIVHIYQTSQYATVIYKNVAASVAVFIVRQL